MSVINKGEKHLFKFRVLQADDTVIPYQDIVSLSLDLTISGEKVANTFSKTDLVESGDYLNLEYDASQNNDGTYYFRGTLVVNDDEFDSGQSNDISWITDPITVTSAFTSYNESETEYDIKFDVDALGTVTISNSTLSSSVTDSTITVSFAKATGSNSANFVYEIYKGDETTVGDVSTIKTESLEATGIDVAELTISGLSELETVFYNVLVRDPASGIEKIYEVNSDVTEETQEPPSFIPSISSTEIVEDSFGLDVPFDKTTFENPEQSGYTYEVTGLSVTGDPVTTLSADNERIDFADFSWSHTDGDILEIRVGAFNEYGNGDYSTPVQWTTNTYGAETTATTFTTA